MRGRHDQALEKQKWAEPSGVQRQHGREQQEQMLGL